MVTAKEEKKNEKVVPKPGEVQEYKGPMSERFAVAVANEFGHAAGGKIELSPFQKRLAQHLFIKIDATLQEMEKKRQESNKEGILMIWQNVNMTKLALSAMDRIELGLDAIIPNHIWPIPYLNTRLQKYDLDLRIGYVGKDYYVRRVAIEEPFDIRYELVYSTDKFEVIKRSKENPIENYNFQIPKPFDRGEIVGGFGYISYKDEKRNELVIVTDKDFKKSRAKAKSDTFWAEHPTEMKMKTLVHRVTSHLRIDPEKVNAAYLRAEAEEDIADAQGVQADIEARANKSDVIDIETGEVLKENEPGNGHGQEPKEPEKEHKTEAKAEETKPEVEDLPPLKAGKESSGKQIRAPGF